MFNNPPLVSEAGLLNKSSCLAQTLGVTKFIMVLAMDLVTLCCATYAGLRCSTNPPLVSEAGLLNKRSWLAAALGVTELIAPNTMILVPLCCAA
jgi:hypothetical protein